MSNIKLTSWWYDITALNVHSPKQDKTDDMMDSFYEEIELYLINSYTPYKTSVRRFQSQSRYRTHFQTNNWE
jgi:hypothetical protein